MVNDFVNKIKIKKINFRINNNIKIIVKKVLSSALMDIKRTEKLNDL